LRTTILSLALALAAWPAATAAQPDLRLRPGDALRVAVKNEPELSGDFPVASDGTVMLPIVGLTAAADRAFDGLRAELAGRYAEELADPEVQITALVRVSVLGEVRNPGLFLVDPTHAVRDVIALAGGLTPSAKRDAILITRGGVEVAAAYEAGADELAGALRSGDEVFVARRSWLSENLGIFVGAAASVAAAAVTSWIVR
jgi:polysaccharide biosynthesis/export protein